MTNLRNTDHLPAVTGLRFIAAMLVVIGHSKDNSPWAAALLPTHHWGQAVPFFFLLSGFILCYAYPQLENWAECRRFWQARFARVYPAHLAMMLITASLFYFNRQWVKLDRPILWFSNLTLTQSWWNEKEIYFSFNSPSWSLSVEAFLYALFPLMIWKWRYLGIPWIIGTFYFTTALDAWYPYVDFPTLPTRKLFLFACGMGAGSLFRLLQHRVPLGRGSGTVLEILTLLTAWNLAEFLGPLGIPHTVTLTLKYALVILVAALGKGWLSWCFSLRPIVVLGEASFSLYLVHIVVLRVISSAMSRSVPDAVFFPCYVGTCVAASLVLWRYWECPARTWILKGRQARRLELSTGAATPEVAIPFEIITAKDSPPASPQSKAA